MNLTTSQRGFEVVQHEAYLPPHPELRLVGQSSAIGGYEDALSRPGSSFLWVGREHHLDRGEVAELAAHLRAWLATGSLDPAPQGDTPAALPAPGAAT